MDVYDKTIGEIRKFNRFYTVNMGFLDAGYLDTEYSVVETRILFEISTYKTCIQSDITKALHIDKSYLSRIIKRFYKDGLIEKDKSEEDKRAVYITLTEKGILETERLIELTNHQIREKVSGLCSDECDALCSALNTIRSILGKEE
ncbi:MAG: MarR family transcriptional regulator [bacterium]|nr:MarR family transcriptional regulator [bacterium]